MKIRNVAVATGVFVMFFLSGMGRGDEGGTVVLNTRSFWRCRLVAETEETRLPSGEVGPFFFKRDKKAKKFIPTKMKVHRVPSHTSAHWMDPGFDDTGWGRIRGGLSGFGPVMKNILLRGRFFVSDPAAAGGLDLSVEFYGGIVVYLNGKEVGRKYMPKGPITLETCAEPYPREAYIDTDGYVLTPERGNFKKYKKRFQMRKRRGEFSIPVSFLKKGVNILALAIHRPPADSIIYTQRIRRYPITAYDPRSRAVWGRVAFLDLSLKARNAAGVVPNVGRPKGFQVWNQSTVSLPYTGDWGDPGVDPSPVRIPAVRNGIFNGALMIGADTKIKGLKVTATDLRGPGVIPARCIRFRYAVPMEDRRRASWRGYPFDLLEDEPPAEVAVDKRGKGAVQPVWISVEVPERIPAGKYKGKITVRAEGEKARTVDMEVNVADWTLPPPSEYHAFLDAIESPESLAFRYEVPLWSEKHWNLLDRTFSLLGRIGAKTLYVTCIRRTHFGNEHAMIRWIRTEEDTLEPDFSIAERYLDTARKHLKKIFAVVLYVWEPPHSGGHAGFGPGRTHDRDIFITVVDPDTGELTAERGPAWGTPECREFWRKLVEGWQRILEKRGLGDALCFGIIGDHRPTRRAMDDICACLPKERAQWVVHSHHYADTWQGYPVKFCATVWGSKVTLVDPDTARGYGWLKGFTVARFPRVPIYMRQYSPLAVYRTYVEMYLGAGIPQAHMGTMPKSLGCKGIGRIGVDFWRCIKRGGRWYSSIAARYPESAWGQLNVTYCMAFLLGPGKKGPVPTLRFETLRENFQEIEARVFIERCLVNEDKLAFFKVGRYSQAVRQDKKRAERLLGKRLYEECLSLLDERTRGCLLTASYPHEGGQVPIGFLGGGWKWFVCSGWNTRTEELFRLASEVARKRRSLGR